MEELDPLELLHHLEGILESDPLIGKPPFHPSSPNAMCDIVVDVATPLDYSPKIPKTFLLRNDLCGKSHFHIRLIQPIAKFAPQKPLDEIGFIHPSQFVLLNEDIGISSASVGSVQKTNFGTLFWVKDHKLGISTKVLFPLYVAAKNAFVEAYKNYKLHRRHDKNTSICSSSSSLSLESELMKHSRALLLLSCDFGTAWNSRKLVMSKKQSLSMFMNELIFSSVILSHSPKSEQAWSQRRWVIKMIAGNCSNLQEIMERESELVKKLAERSKMNYRAWYHRCWLVSYMSEEQVLQEFNKSREWAGLHVADNSCFHYREVSFRYGAIIFIQASVN
ncbi:hypothetical protein H5410_010014 [Solanum commersonii]|uniref:Uncharacterized protein n=1 Tax=Solanum commersonii TaxID=4109 RepID=A0A9J6AKE0_SOLCO|nr:hypothetical protein H5410_010014 [Solanum commersonii]